MLKKVLVMITLPRCWLQKGTLFLLLISFNFSYAQTEGDQSGLLMDKLSQVYQHLAPNDPSKVAVTLRLADLFAERARTEALKEITQGCAPCKAGDADRKKALQLYNEVLARAPEAVQGKVIVQVGHLYQLTGEEGKAIGVYERILRESALAELKAEARMSLAEIYFKRREFAKARTFYQEFLKTATSVSRGLAAYRSAWCAFNLNDIAGAIQQIEEVLRTPALLARNGANQTQIDPQFQEEVSRDYVTFLAKKSVDLKDIEKLYQLSPESIRVENLKSLALDLERVGKKSEALRVWTFAFGFMSKPEDRLAAKISMAQLYFDTDHKKEGAESFESAMSLGQELKACQSTSCEELRRRSRQFVVAWNQLEKKTPTSALFAAYVSYLQNFPEDVEMNLYAANIAKEHKNWEASWDYYHKALGLQLKDVKKDARTPANLETTLVALLDLAETSNIEKFKTEVYELYLVQSVQKTKTFEVRYQKAHRLYEQGQYPLAAQELRSLALEKNAKPLIRKQAADLSLDALVLMKEEALLGTWAGEYAQALPQDSREFLQLVQKGILSQSAQTAAQDKAAAYTELEAFQPALASAEDRIIFYRNKLILAEQLKRFSQAQAAAEDLLQQPDLAADDAEFAWAKKASLAEMRLDFATVLTATAQLKRTLKPDEKYLKMAMFAELSGQKSSPYYAHYLQTSKDEEGKRLVVAELVRKAKNPEKEIELRQNILSKSPQLMAQLYAEVFAKTSSEAVLKKVFKNPAMKASEAGKLLTRLSFLRDFKNFKTTLLAHKLDSKNDRKLAATIKSRVALLEKLERFTKQAIESGDWTSQLVSLETLAKESERFYADLLSAPMPAHLSEDEQQHYLQLLAAQATPFQAKALEAKSKVDQFWKSANWRTSLKRSWQQAELRSLIVSEVKVLRELAPAEFQADLTEMMAVKKEPLAPAARPSLKEIETARALVQKNPFDKQALEALLALEKKSENAAMAQYLQTRIENLALSSEQGVL